MNENETGHARVIASLSAARAGVYQILAKLYLDPPTPELVSGLLALSGDMTELFDGEGATCLGRYGRAYTGDIDSLQQEFHDLFTVPLGRYVAPYEAVYRDERVVGEARVSGLLMGPSTLAAISEYRQSGAHVLPDCAELPDHIGVELSFMAFLCARQQEAWQEGDQNRAQQALDRERHFRERPLLQ